MLQQISGVVITKNEEHNIRDCILSLQKVADEIIVLDSFSSDRTEQICIELGVRFEQHPFEGMIEQKREVVSRVTKSHVLLLDADERLSHELIQFIKSEKENGLKVAYQFNRLNNYCGRWIKYCGWYPDQKIRLWKAGATEIKGVNPHDEVVAKKGIEVETVQEDILHYSYRSIEEHERQIINYSSIAAQEAYARGKRTHKAATYIKPAFKFFRDYILKLGFMDGYHGWLVCRMGAHAKRMKYLKLYALQKR